MTDPRQQLRPLGFDDFFNAQLTSREGLPARVAAEHRGAYEVWAGPGQGMAQLAGRLMQQLEGEAFPGVGDWVLLRSAPGPGQTSVIDGILERRSVFVRGAAGKDSRAQVIAANVDRVFVVSGLDEDYNPRRIERYLARIWASGALPTVILNKADLCDEVDDRIYEIERSSPGVAVLTTNALEAHGTEDIRALLAPGETAAFVGSSGAGKSTLINALLGEERMATRAVSLRDGRGRHTTTHRQLIRLPEGVLLIDTPGMRELQLVDDEGLDSVFTDIQDLAAGCRFRDCTHENEPGCAVRKAVEAGELPAERLAHYRELEAEAQAYALRHNEHERRKADRAFGKITREADRIRDYKRGK